MAGNNKNKNKKNNRFRHVSLFSSIKHDWWSDEHPRIEPDYVLRYWKLRVLKSIWSAFSLNPADEFISKPTHYTLLVSKHSECKLNLRLTCFRSRAYDLHYYWTCAHCRVLWCALNYSHISVLCDMRSSVKTQLFLYSCIKVISYCLNAAWRHIGVVFSAVALHVQGQGLSVCEVCMLSLWVVGFLRVLLVSLYSEKTCNNCMRVPQLAPLE